MVVKKLLLIIAIFTSIVGLQGSQALFAATLPVELTISETMLQVLGRASPNALVTIKEAGSVLTSITADSSGNFATSISRTAGLHTISVNYTDVNGVMSQTNTQTISVAPQQTTTQTLFMAPTLSRLSAGPIVSGSIVQFRGYTVPNALVTMRIDYNVFSYETISDANGFYEFIVDSSVIGFGNHIATTLTMSGASLSDVSLSSSFEIVPTNTPSPPDIIVSPTQLPPPTTQSPNDGAIIDGDSVIIYGESVPNAQINIYENNVLFGSVFADKLGKWSFKYTASFTPVTLSFEACIDGRCSLMSKTLTLEFSGLNKTCKLDLALEEYRFWGVEAGSKTTIRLVKNSAGTIYIDWGNGTIERLNIAESSMPSFENIYETVGNYNGKISIQSLNNSNCVKDIYFSVSSVSKSADNQSRNVLLLLSMIAGLILLNYIDSKDKQKTIKKQ
jgi:hypothetical protein